MLLIRVNIRSVSPIAYLLGHGSHRAGDRDQVVAAEVDLCKRGNVTDGQGKLTEVVVGQVEAPQTGKSGNGG